MKCRSPEPVEGRFTEKRPSAGSGLLLYLYPDFSSAFSRRLARQKKNAGISPSHAAP
jgi:hypothetical protein